MEARKAQQGCDSPVSRTENQDVVNRINISVLTVRSINKCLDKEENLKGKLRSSRGPSINLIRWPGTATKMTVDEIGQSLGLGGLFLPSACKCLLKLFLAPGT